jgi:hypothetical protein
MKEEDYILSVAVLPLGEIPLCTLSSWTVWVCSMVPTKRKEKHVCFLPRIELLFCQIYYFLVLLPATGWKTEGSSSSPCKGEMFFLHVILFESGAHTAFYAIDSGGRALSPEVNRPEREADYSSPANTEAKGTWIHASTPHTPS